MLAKIKGNFMLIKIQKIIKTSIAANAKLKESNEENQALKKLIIEKDRIINNLELFLKEQKDKVRELENELKCERTFGL